VDARFRRRLKKGYKVPTFIHLHFQGNNPNSSGLQFEVAY